MNPQWRYPLRAAMCIFHSLRKAVFGLNKRHHRLSKIVLLFGIWKMQDPWYWKETMYFEPIITDRVTYTYTNINIPHKSIKGYWRDYHCARPLRAIFSSFSIMNCIEFYIITHLSSVSIVICLLSSCLLSSLIALRHNKVI